VRPASRSVSLCPMSIGPHRPAAKSQSKRAARHHRPEDHRVGRIGWLRAAVLGANDGIVSTAALLVGVIEGGGDRAVVLTAGVAGLTAGALSMAVGEYVSVSSQRDLEEADLREEAAEIEAHPEAERAELAMIYRERGLEPDLAQAVADQLSARDDILEIHAREELGLTPGLRARPFQAAAASASAFSAGAVLPLGAAAVAGGAVRTTAVVAVALVTLALLGVLGALAGRAPYARAAARVVLGGAGAMALTGLIGRLVGTAVG
jgi:vacuolar iron transporter family protein